MCSRFWKPNCRYKNVGALTYNWILLYYLCIYTFQVKMRNIDMEIEFIILKSYKSNRCYSTPDTKGVNIFKLKKMINRIITNNNGTYKVAHHPLVLLALIENQPLNCIQSCDAWINFLFKFRRISLQGIWKLLCSVTCNRTCAFFILTSQVRKEIRT